MWHRARGGLSTWDYVVDRRQRLGVIRGLTTDGAQAVVWPAYVPSTGGGLRKIAPAEVRARRTEWESLYDDCCLSPVGELRLAYAWDHRPCAARRGSLPADIRTLADAVERYGGRLYLYGSRALGIHDEAADWDFVMDHDGDARSLIEQASRACGVGEPLDEPTLRRHAEDYAYPHSAISLEDLLEIMRTSLTYLTVGQRQLDIMPRPRRVRESIPSSFRAVPGSVVVGKVLPSRGTSYAMPRILRMRSATGARVEIRHLSWRLSGLERLRDHTLMFSALYESRSGGLWFHARRSGLRLLG